MKILFNILVLTLLSMISFTAHATNGVLEINHTCAVELGCFSGDITAGYPIVIDGSAGRSYRLTSDLVIPNKDTHGIEITTSSISIDLNGFEIVSPACVGASENCSPAAGTGSGIYVSSISKYGISIKNGSIIGMGNHGIDIKGEQSEVSGLRVRWNKGDGIHTSGFSTISDCSAFENGINGISSVEGSLIKNNISTLNSNEGILTSNGSTIIKNTIFSNGNNGISTGTGSTVSYNTVYDNKNNGIIAFEASTIQGNTILNNTSDGINSGAGSTIIGNTVVENRSAGIRMVSPGGLVLSNTVTKNYGWQLNLGSDIPYRENMLRRSVLPGSILVIGGFDLGYNFCESIICSAPAP